MHRLAPLLAYTFGFVASSKMLISIVLEQKERAAKNDFSLLDLAHHLSAGFKSLYTYLTYEGLNTIRQSCGGAGFSAFSGLP
mmetsp:Transcript_2379/g.2329  ORF Transcript_2379/g.2329 Transcript_2379/m.2329 type:complete len:82 (-) Transcript_2379:274-519(-)